MSSEPLITFCALTYGDYHSLINRCLKSIRQFCPRENYRLVVGANSPSLTTSDYLNELVSIGHINRLCQSNSNINKCPMMRRMFEGIGTKYIWWLDDDSYFQSSVAFETWLKAAEESPNHCTLWGVSMMVEHHSKEFGFRGPVIRFVRQAPWYRRLPPPSKEPGGKGEFFFEGKPGGDGRWFFCAGGSWLIRTEAVKKMDWPDSRLVKEMDDVLLGEAIRQQGWKIRDVPTEGIVINGESRRGDVGYISANQFLQRFRNEEPIESVSDE